MTDKITLDGEPFISDAKVTINYKPRYESLTAEIVEHALRETKNREAQGQGVPINYPPVYEHTDFTDGGVGGKPKDVQPQYPPGLQHHNSGSVRRGYCLYRFAKLGGVQLELPVRLSLHGHSQLDRRLVNASTDYPIAIQCIMRSVAFRDKRGNPVQPPKPWPKAWTWLGEVRS